MGELINFQCQGSWNIRLDERILNNYRSRACRELPNRPKAVKYETKGIKVVKISEKTILSPAVAGVVP